MLGWLHNEIRSVTLGTNLVRTVLKSDGISDLVTEIDAHFLGDAFSHRHCSDAPRLRAADHAIVRVSVLVQVLSHTHKPDSHLSNCIQLSLQSY